MIFYALDSPSWQFFNQIPAISRFFSWVGSMATIDQPIWLLIVVSYVRFFQAQFFPEFWMGYQGFRIFTVDLSYLLTFWNGRKSKTTGFDDWLQGDRKWAESLQFQWSGNDQRQVALNDDPGTLYKDSMTERSEEFFSQSMFSGSGIATKTATKSLRICMGVYFCCSTAVITGFTEESRGISFSFCDSVSLVFGKGCFDGSLTFRFCWIPGTSTCNRSVQGYRNWRRVFRTQDQRTVVKYHCPGQPCRFSLARRSHNFIP